MDRLYGYDLNPEHEGNAIFMDGSKHGNALIKEYPSATLGASGLSVGLPDGKMGNSEARYLNIGAGRIVYRDLTKITKAIKDGDFFENPALIKAMDSARENCKSTFGNYSPTIMTTTGIMKKRAMICSP